MDRCHAARRYTLTYSTGDKAKDVTLIIAQWSASDNAKTQYDALASAQTGDELAAGNVKVSGSTTGSYTVKVDALDGKNAVAIWQNDTVVFRAPVPRPPSSVSTRSSRCKAQRIAQICR